METLVNYSTVGFHLGTMPRWLNGASTPSVNAQSCVQGLVRSSVQCSRVGSLDGTLAFRKCP